MGFLELIYPNKCKCCMTDLSKGQKILCYNCLKKGNYYLYEAFDIDFTDEADSPLVYRDFIRNAMHEYKFRGKKSYADWFASFTTECIVSKLDKWNVDFITYVPMSFFGKLRRGYNQSELVAKITAESLGLPIVKTLKKKPFVKRQSLISDKNKRFENVQNAFKILNMQSVKNKRILIIDDVITTGATMKVCAKILRENGADAVFAVSMTKTPVKRQKI